MSEEQTLTPMFRQYAEQKEQHKDAVLFFRMGDFYEMFRSDAVEVSRLLNLTLTQRQGVPMCGVPYHAAGNYIARLLKLGKKIAICEQIELPVDGKGLARREVIEIVTPGTVVDDTYLDERSNNYLAAVAGKAASPAFAYVDLSTGEFRVTRLSAQNPREALRRELARTSPREIIVQESLLEHSTCAFLQEEHAVLDRLPDWSFDQSAALARLKKCFGTLSLKAFGLADSDERIPAAGAVLEYLETQHKGLMPHIRALSVYTEDDAVGLDESTIRNLELIRNLQDGGGGYTLLSTLDHTRTSAGARLLKRRILQPFPNAAEAETSHLRVEQLYHDQALLTSLRNLLGGILDLERLAARTAMDRAHAKDLLAIRNSLLKAGEIYRIAGEHLSAASDIDLEHLFEECAALAEFLDKSLMEEPSILLSEGRLIKAGWDAETDRMREIRDKGRQFLHDYVAEEKSATGISSLKLKFNKILGYFIEVPRSQADKMPPRFRRRQSLTQSERFSTDRLDELETELLSVGERIVERERNLFLDIRSRVKENVPSLQTMAGILADLDLVQSYAHAATEYGYVKPEMTDDVVCDIQGGRHPVVERHLPSGSFVPNSIRLAGEETSFALVTGPNMAGKSTVLRQVALITLMAQIGSFVPADAAKIGVADKIFCRVGASDNLARGESTFLVEMHETANILRSATARSLVIMDEVGRGTGTEDGLCIARAVCEYLLAHASPRTLFATHYRELTRLTHPNLANYSMTVKEEGNDVIFLKQLVEGPAEASYGIHVAALAGIPDAVVRRAQQLMSHAAGEGRDTVLPDDVPALSADAPSPLLFDPVELVLDSIRGLNTDKITPLEALQFIAGWKKDLSGSREKLMERDPRAG